ncbi:MAG: hypothetical protein P8X74_21550 [Reinekea sp.]
MACGLRRYGVTDSGSNEALSISRIFTLSLKSRIQVKYKRIGNSLSEPENRTSQDNCWKQPGRCWIHTDFLRLSHRTLL